MAERTLSGSRWLPHLNLIAKRYIEDRRTYEQIAEELAFLGLNVTGNTVKAKLREWKIGRLTPDKVLTLMASCFLYHQQNREIVNFQRWGTRVPQHEILDVIDRIPDIVPSGDDLPCYLQIVTNKPDEIAESTSLLRQNGHMENSKASGEAEKNVRLSTSDHATRLNKKRKYETLVSVRQDIQKQEKVVAAEQVLKLPDTEAGAGEDTKQKSKSMLLQAQEGITAIKKLFRHSDIKPEAADKAIKETEKLVNEITGYEQSVKAKEKNTDLGPMHYAAYNDNVRILQVLLDQGADVNGKGGPGVTPLHMAAQQGHFAALKTLLQQEDIDLDATSHKGSTALHLAIAAQSLRCALLLVRQGTDVDISGPGDNTALHIACTFPNMEELVVQLLKKTSKLNFQNREKQTPLHVAMGCEHWNYVDLLVEYNADLNIQNIDGRTPMHQACFDAPADLLLALVDKNVDLSVKGNGDETILHLLCQRPDLCDVVRAVLTKDNIDINARSHKAATPLMLAAENNSLETVKLLVNCGADLEARGQHLDTALGSAIWRGHDDIAEFLIKRGSPLNSINQSPLRYKAELEHNRGVQGARSAIKFWGTGKGRYDELLVQQPRVTGLEAQ